MVPGRPCSLDLRVRTGEARSKSPACGSLHRRWNGGARSRRRYTELLLARQITLLQAFLVPEQALLCRQQALLCALLPQALRRLRLQLLHALLQPIDAALTLHALARKHVALPFLRGLLELLHPLLPLELPLFCLQQALLRGLRPRAVRLLRLQLLNALLQPIDTLLALHALGRNALGRRHVARALRLRGLLPLLDGLLALAGPLLLRRARAQSGRCARA